MSLQNDFCEKVEKLSKEEIDNIYNHKIHLDYEETKRFWGPNNEFENFISDFMKTSAIANSKEDDNKEYHLIHIRDWHDNSDKNQLPELLHFGNHCIKGTHGSRFISPMDELIEQNLAFNLVVNSNSLNSFVDTNLEKNLCSMIESCGVDKSNVYIGIIGFVTNVKILFLAYDLSITYNYPNVFLCEDLTAAFNKLSHERGLDLISTANLAKVQKIQEFRNTFLLLK